MSGDDERRRYSEGGDNGACTGKVGYLTWELAKKSMRAHRLHGRGGRGYMNPYRCRHCSTWHLGHNNR